MVSIERRHNLRTREDSSMPSSLLVSVLLLLSDEKGILASISSSPPKRQTFHLHPTSALDLDENGPQDSQRRHLRESWFHPQSNGIYATLPKASDQTEHAADFHAYRHLSRYERHHRSSRSLDLDTSWDGVYLRSDNAAFGQDIRRLGEDDDYTFVDASPYQALPLNQGYGTHYVNLWVGRPTPQRKTVIVDTGSHYTAFPCDGCTRCGEGHHTDPYFQPELSQTFHPLQCNECIRGATCRDGKCYFSQSYTEGSSWNAYLAQDEVFCGGNDILDAASPENQEFSIPFMFGCQTQLSGLFITQLADGIMGLSAHESTLPKRLYDFNKIDHNMFTMCFQRQLGTSRHGVTAGVMTLGGIDERLHASEMAYAKNVVMMGWFTVYVKNIFIQHSGDTHKIPMDIASVNSGKGVIVDSGTTDTYLQKQLAKPFNAVWKEVTGKDYHHKPISLTENQLKQLPTILVQCAAALDSNGVAYNSMPSSSKSAMLAGDVDPESPLDVIVAIPPTSYMEYSPLSKMYTSRIYFTESQGGVLGANAMLGHNVLFDWGNGRVGFAKSSCEYNEGENADEPALVETAMDETSDNCILGDAVLSATCLDSLDLEQCQSNQNRILRGHEAWSMVVKNHGAEEGISCDRAAAVKAAYKDRERSKISCDRSGICTEHRPCRLKCADVSNAVRLKALAQVQSEEGRDDCDDSWSACDESCTQTQVVTEFMSDGLCHEKSRISRPCHIGECAKSRPCHVPYVVRAAIGFKRRDSTTWSRRSNESLLAALAGSLQGTPSGNHTVFSPGDVRVISCGPWVSDSNDDVEKDVVIGSKVVVEISIVNPNEESMAIVENNPTSLASLVKGLRREPEAPQCDNTELYPLARTAVKVKAALQSSPIVEGVLSKALGFSPRTLAVTIVSNVKKEDEVIPMGAFSAGFHTHRLRQYARRQPFMAICFFLSVSFIIFSVCISFELLLTMALKKTAHLFDEKSETDAGALTDTSLWSDDEHIVAAPMTPDDDLSQVSNKSHEKEQDYMLERLLYCAVGTPPRKIKSESSPSSPLEFEQTHSVDESFDRSVSRGASPRKRKTEHGTM